MPCFTALFHALARAGAESLVGSQKAVHGDEAWIRVYRALDHKQAKQACTDRQALRHFPEDFQDFAATFVNFQMMRHDCDYDPQERLSKAVVLQDIDTAEAALRRFARASARERRAFVALVLFRRRP